MEIAAGDTSTDATTGEQAVDSYEVTVQYDGPVTDATAASHVLYQDNVDTPRLDLDASMDAEASSLEDGTLVFEVTSDTAARGNLFAAIEDDALRAAGVGDAGAEIAIGRDG